MNNRKRTLITIVCSILLIMPSFLGVPLADGNLFVIPTPDSGQVNDEISTNTDLNDDNIKTMVIRELLLETDSDETAPSDSEKIQEHTVRTEDGNDDNSNISISAEHLGTVESKQFSQSYVATEPNLIPEAQSAAENTSETTSFWPLIPSYGGVGNATDNVGLLAGLETLPSDDVNSKIVNDASIPHDMNLTTVDDALMNILSNATVLVEETYSIVKQPDLLNVTLGVVTINETTFTPTPDLGGSITFKTEGTDGELGINIARGLYDDSVSLINGRQPIFDTLTIDQNYTIIYAADPAFSTSDSSQHSISDGDGGTNTEKVLSSTDAPSEPPVATDYVGSTITENSPIQIDVLANSFDADNSSLVVSSTIQGVYETMTDNHDDNTAFSSESTTIGGSDLSSSDSVNIIVFNTNGGSSGDGNNKSSHASSDENEDNGGQCSSSSVRHSGQDKHRDDVKGIGGVHNERHADSESTHNNDTRVSHKDSEHEDRGGSDDDRDHNDHEDGHQNNHDESDYNDHGQHGDQNDE